MKKFKFTLISMFILLLTSCGSTEKKSTESSTQIGSSKEKIDTTESTNQKEK